MTQKKLLLALTVVTTLVSGSAAAQVTCTVNTGMPPIVRAEGMSLCDHGQNAGKASRH